jgi:predicted nuclease of predicted toxin-antitoxin system
MKLLVDANIAVQIVQQLRAAGHDVLYAAEQTEGIADTQWLALANRDGRILITDDKDFGELVFRRGMLSSTVVLLRLHNLDLRSRIEWLESRWHVILAAPERSFVVVTERRMRIRGQA